MKLRIRFNDKLTEKDIIKYYALYSKYNPVSDIIGVISKNFKQTMKYIKRKYDKTYTILPNVEGKSIIVVKGDFLKKYIVLDTLDDVNNSKYKFRRYL